MRTLRKKPMKTEHLTVITLVMMIICRRCIWKGYKESKMKKKTNQMRKTMMKHMKNKKKKG
eukprot:6243239-Ditylum_brightwellii.AAC.1